MGPLSVLPITSDLIIWFHFNSFLLSLANILTIYQYWQDIIRESAFQGHHTPTVQKGLQYGMILPITSEVFFFTGFFWAFYLSRTAAKPELGGCWPLLNLLEVSLLNTSVLLASRVSITLAQHRLKEGNWKCISQAFFVTVFLGIYLTLLQTSEYYEIPFTIWDGIRIKKPYTDTIYQYTINFITYIYCILISSTKWLLTM